ncbi:hypothetical protein QTO34_016585 [Cnephaeus nilssonii]|uniref:Uncharacterized protein n=1 Tax=Cnephaeus nilssonii TaxID=3371016 RepID=A0AA40LSA7_CNENI|nr:hypothetical protein QTO34_016585 [Eptesicus nilssonii]
MELGVKLQSACTEPDPDPDPDPDARLEKGPVPGPAVPTHRGPAQSCPEWQPGAPSPALMELLWARGAGALPKHILTESARGQPKVQTSLGWRLPSRPGPPEACVADSGNSRRNDITTYSAVIQESTGRVEGGLASAGHRVSEKQERKGHQAKECRDWHKPDTNLISYCSCCNGLDISFLHENVQTESHKEAGSDGSAMVNGGTGVGGGRTGLAGCQAVGIPSSSPAAQAGGKVGAGDFTSMRVHQAVR